MDNLLKIWLGGAVLLMFFDMGAAAACNSSPKASLELLAWPTALPFVLGPNPPSLAICEGYPPK